MRGRAEVTMDGKTRITWVLKPSQNTQRIRARRLTVGTPEPSETLQAKLIAATVEFAAEGSSPRLTKTLYAPIGA